jgi:ubiquinone/menaquinone biosynthesis C-methylase UbiE
MESYYSEKLSAERLKMCYEIAPQRIKRYLNAEIEHVLGRMKPGSTVLELGCGYGRVLSKLAQKAGLLVGIDISHASLVMAHDGLGSRGMSKRGKKRKNRVDPCSLIRANALQLPFPDRAFDLVVCIQNGISAFHVDHSELMREAFRVTRRGGRTMFSSYSDRFWVNRLEWFRLQAEAGLMGEIDEEKARRGIIETKDGFKASTVRAADFLALTNDLNAEIQIEEVDESSLFCEIVPRE